MCSERIKSRQYILRGKSSFDRLFRHGRKVYGGPVNLLLLEIGPTEGTRVAICAGRKLAKAVYRNRLKRITRDALQPMLTHLKPGFMVAIFPRLALEQLNPAERSEALMQALRRAGLLNRDKERLNTLL